MGLHFFTRFPFPRLDYNIFGWCLGKPFVGLNFVNIKSCVLKDIKSHFFNTGPKNIMFQSFTRNVLHLKPQGN